MIMGSKSNARRGSSPIPKSNIVVWSLLRSQDPAVKAKTKSGESRLQRFTFLALLQSSKHKSLSAESNRRALDMAVWIPSIVIGRGKTIVETKLFK
mmetsp:Transcript_150868/g.266840  ORF Transcript_150868/g.266840 Transcript_150868/m.266840 type:complete len:96 (+) Transcript_150868:644-931(+)